MSLKIGDCVRVTLPNGERAGKIVAVLPNYAWSGETHYEIHGHQLVTISSARSLALDD